MDFRKSWNENQYYNFKDEFNRIEKQNQYCDNWLKNYYNYSYKTLTHKTNWTLTDIVDLKDYNRVKDNINTMLSLISTTTQLPIMYDTNQTFNYKKANELENNMSETFEIIGNTQFQTNVCGLTICNNNLHLNIG